MLKQGEEYKNIAKALFVTRDNDAQVQNIFQFMAEGGNLGCVRGQPGAVFWRALEQNPGLPDLVE